MFNLKLKAGALQLILIVTVIIALLLLSFILLVDLHKKSKIEFDFIVESIKATDKGISYGMHNKIAVSNTISVPIGKESFKTLSLTKEYWGVYEKLKSVSKIKNKQFRKVALIGAKQPNNNRTALYVKDNNRPLVLAGNTKISGTVYLPKQGVTSGTISGHSYYGSKLIDGAMLVSSAFPSLNSETLNQIKSINKSVNKIQEDNFIDVKPNTPYINSFFEPTKMLFSNSTIYLRDITLTGHIIVQSKRKIIVDQTATLKDVVLVAPEITIKKNVNGYFQAIASKSIYVENNVTLKYPSALVLNPNNSNKKQSRLKQPQKENQIIIEKSTKIEGVVLYLDKLKPNNYSVQVKLDENSIIKGELYCNQNIELRGAVYGAVYADNFIVNHNGSVYQNHIFNGEVSVNDLPQEYIGLLFKNSKCDVLKWLY